MTTLTHVNTTRVRSYKNKIQIRREEREVERKSDKNKMRESDHPLG
jgi:hypothetical protein